MINFIFANARDDERPYLEVSILEQNILGLLDSATSRIIAGQLGCGLLQGLGLPIRKDISRCAGANGLLQ